MTSLGLRFFWGDFLEAFRGVTFRRKPRGLKMPKDFRKDVGRISQKDLVEKYSCQGGNLLVETVSTKICVKSFY